MARASAILAVCSILAAVYLHFALPAFRYDLRVMQMFSPVVFWAAIAVTAWGALNVLARRRPGLKLLAAGITAVLMITQLQVRRANQLLSTDDIAVVQTEAPSKVHSLPIDPLGQTLLQNLFLSLTIALICAVVAAIQKVRRSGP